MREDDPSQGPGRAGAEGWPDRASLAVVRAVADRQGEPALELPVLNGTVDPDALDDLAGAASGADASPERGMVAWPAVTTTYDGRAVRIDPIDGVTLSAPAREWEHVSGIDAEDPVPAIVLELADRTGQDLASVRNELSRVVDLDALSRLNRPRANGAPRTGATVRFSTLGYDVAVGPGGVSIGSTSRRLQAGGNVLVVGAVPDAIVDSAGSKLLCGGANNLFALFDREIGTVSTQLPPDAAADATVLNHATTARSATGAAVGGGDDPDARPAVTDVRGDLEAVRGAIEAELADTPDGELRLCLASLRPLVETRGPAAVREFLAPLCEAVRKHSALAHYTLPIVRESPPVRAIESAFEATLELRLEGAIPEQRWHFQDSGYTTEWARLER